jgi:RNA polymerase sigma-70 factor (ECF subfamily)
MTTTSTIRQLRKSRALGLTQVSDEQLLLRYRDAGDQDAFAVLVRRYERELFNYLRRYLGDADHAEDVFQATFLQVHRRCHLFEQGRRVRPWLYTIANHQAIDWMRRTRRRAVMSLDVPSGRDGDNTSLVAGLESSMPDPVAQVEAQEERAWARRAVTQLPEPLRAALVLIYFEGLKYRDAAEALHVPEGTLKTRVHAAIDALRRRHALLCTQPAPWRASA